MVFAFFVCFDSLPFLFRTTEGFIFPSPSRALGLGGTVHLCWVFPQVPAKAAQFPSESPGRPHEGSRLAAVCPLLFAAGFDQVLWGLLVA